MARIKIKIQDLYKRLNTLEEKCNTSKNSFKTPYNIKIKNHLNKFVKINEFIKIKTDSYKITLLNGKSLILSNEHIIKTKNGEKKICDIGDKDLIICEEGYTKIKYIKLLKKDDTLYDFSLDYPHLYKDTSGFIHHNSIIIAYIIKTLYENNITKKHLIICPTKSLVEQFFNDLIEYGIDKNIIGRVYDKYKEFDSPICISTWQSLQNRHDVLPNYDCIIVDECHINGMTIREILSKCANANYRLGFTGTLPTSQLDLWNVKSYLGPILKEYNARHLIKRGYISKCTIKTVNIDYREKYDGKYDEVKDSVFRNEYRMNELKTIVSNVDKNILVLVGKVKKEGKILENYFSDIKGKEVVFIYGDTKVKVRENWRRMCEEREDIILIATYSLFQLGINIKSLKYVLFASPFVSKIRVLQSIGRSLRKHSDKVNGAIIYDIIDDCKYLKTHGDTRLQYYDSEGFDIEETFVYE